MAFNLADYSVQIKDQLDDAVGGITVASIDEVSLESADVHCLIDPSTKLGTKKLVITTQSGVFSKDHAAICIPNDLRSFFPSEAGARDGAPGGDGVLPYQPGGSPTLSLSGFGMYHLNNGIFSAAGLGIHQPGVSGQAQGWVSGALSAGSLDFAAGAQIPLMVDIMDHATGNLNTLIEVSSVTVAGRDQADRLAASAALSIPASDAMANSLLPEGKKDYSVRLRAWDGNTALRTAVSKNAGDPGDALAFQIALEPIASATATIVDATGSAVALAAADLTAGVGGTRDLTVTCAAAGSRACLGTQLGHGVTITHDVFTSKAFNVSNKAVDPIDATGKILSCEYSIPADSPQGTWNVKVFGDQNGAGIGVTVGQVTLSAQDIVVNVTSLNIASVAPGPFDAADNQAQEWGEMASWALELAAGANLPGAGEGTALWGYLKKESGGATFTLPLENVAIIDDDSMTFDVDLRAANDANHLNGADLDRLKHTGVFTLVLDVYEHEDTDAAAEELWGEPDEGATALSSGSYDSVFITCEKPAPLNIADTTLMSGAAAEYAGVRTAEADRWVQAGTDSALGASHDFVYVGVNMAEAAYEAGVDNDPVAELIQVGCEITKQVDDGAGGWTTEVVSCTVADDLVAPHGTGDKLFLINSVFASDGSTYKEVDGREQRGLKTQLTLSVQAVHEVGQYAANVSTGIESSLDGAGEEVEGSRYDVRIMTRACDSDQFADNEALFFSGDRSFYTFPSAIQGADLVDALLEVDESAALEEIIQIVSARGLYPAHGNVLRIAELANTDMRLSGGAPSKIVGDGSDPVNVAVSDLTGAVSAGVADVVDLFAHVSGIEIDFVEAASYETEAGNQFDDVVKMWILDVDTEGYTDGELLTAINGMAEYTGLTSEHILHEDAGGSELITFQTNPQGLEDIRIVMFCDGTGGANSGGDNIA